jgi:hypothetical protein
MFDSISKRQFPSHFQLLKPVCSFKQKNVLFLWNISEGFYIENSEMKGLMLTYNASPIGLGLWNFSELKLRLGR